MTTAGFEFKYIRRGYHPKYAYSTSLLCTINEPIKGDIFISMLKTKLTIIKASRFIENTLRFTRN